MPLKSAKRSSVSWPGLRASPRATLAQEIVDQHFWVDLFLDIERWGVNDEVAPVLLILAPPDELRVEVPIAPIVRHTHRRLVLVPGDRLELGGRDVLPRVVVREGLDGLLVGRLAGHRFPYHRLGVTLRPCRAFLARPDRNPDKLSGYFDSGRAGDQIPTVCRDFCRDFWFRLNRRGPRSASRDRPRFDVSGRSQRVSAKFSGPSSRRCRGWPSIPGWWWLPCRR